MKKETTRIENTEQLSNAESFEQKPSALSKIPFKINIHIVLLAVFVLFVLAIIFKFSTWGVHVDLDEIFKDGYGTYDNSFDSILPLITADGDPVYEYYGEGTNILFFGNAPLADDRDSEDNLVNMIQEKTGANVYNCSISGSYLASTDYGVVPDVNPNDAFNFYWLCFLPLGDLMDQSYLTSVKELTADGECPPEAMDVYNTLKTIDLNSIDVIALMYDGSDYLAGREMYSDGGDSDPITFTGNMLAGITMLQAEFPHIRFIVMSPTYAYGLDEDGNYVSSDIQRYGQDVLSTYVIKQAELCSLYSLTYVDHLYGTVNANNAKEYLIDHIHLNPSGREAVANRFVDALTYYNNRVK